VHLRVRTAAQQLACGVVTVVPGFRCSASVFFSVAFCAGGNTVESVLMYSVYFLPFAWCQVAFCLMHAE
jgi:hypothetical protein